jgi:hypothetical protein
MLLFAEGLSGSGTAFLENDSRLAVGRKYVFRQYGGKGNWIIRYGSGELLSLPPSRGLAYIHLLLERPGELLTAPTLVDLLGGHAPVQGELAKEAEADKSLRKSNSFNHLLDGIDQQDIRHVKNELQKLKDKLEEAKEFGNNEDIARYENEIEQLASYLRSETGPFGRVKRENKPRKRSRTAVTIAIFRAIERIATCGSLDARDCAAHFKKQIKTGFALCYRDTSVKWWT